MTTNGSGSDAERLAAKRRLAVLLAEKNRRAARRKLFSLYPDTGPLRRELYPKHLAFFAAGATEYDRCMLAANRIGKCVTANTVMQTRRGDRTMVELFDAGEPVELWSWNGSERVPVLASTPFEKPGEHECYRVTMSDGRWFEGADHHRVLASDGAFYFLAELHQEFVAGRLQTTQELCPSDRRPDARHLTRTPSGFQGHYSVGRRPHDGRPQSVLGSGRVWLPSPADALQRAFAWSRAGVLAHNSTSSYPLGSGRLSSRCAFRQPLAQSVAFGSQNDGTSAQSWFGPYQVCGRLPLESEVHPQSYGELARGTDCTQQRALRLPLVDGAEIVSIKPIGRNKVYDLSVPIYHNYLTAGVVHHNSFGVGGYETALHLTGAYPEWWVGRRFSHPTDAWAAGDTSETTRDIVQAILMGPLGELGKGLIPGDSIIGEPSRRAGVTGAMDTARVRHVSGGTSIVGFKSFDQGRRKFQGTAKHMIWLDEEPPQDVHEECMIRLMTTNGLMIVTYTPMSGMTEIGLRYLQSMAS